MSQFVIEYELEKVKSQKTKKYLLEVIKNYNSECYRSTIVVLYSVVIYDLIEKLNILSDIYKDEVASSILSEIEAEQKNNPTSPKWEVKLVEDICARTELLNLVDKKKIEHLKDERNYCAHPLYDNKYELISPNKEQDRAYIRNMFEIVFKKDPLLSKKIIKYLENDLKEYYDKLKIEDVKIYFRDKYLNHLNQATKITIFKFLWKMIFIKENNETNNYRELYFTVIKYLITENTEIILHEIQTNSHYYTNISAEMIDISYGEDVSLYKYRFTALIYLLFYIPRIKNYLNESTLNMLDKTANKNVTLNILLNYPKENEESFFDEVLENIKNYCIDKDTGYFNVEKYHSIPSKTIRILAKKLIEVDSIYRLVKFSCDYFIGSPSFKSAYDIFFDIITYMLEYFSENDFVYLLDGMNKNNQIYSLHQLRKIMDILRNSIIQKGYNINYSEYNNLPKYEENGIPF